MATPKSQVPATKPLGRPTCHGGDDVDFGMLRDLGQQAQWLLDAIHRHGQAWLELSVFDQRNMKSWIVEFQIRDYLCHSASAGADDSLATGQWPHANRNEHNDIGDH